MIATLTAVRAKIVPKHLYPVVSFDTSTEQLSTTREHSTKGCFFTPTQHQQNLFTSASENALREVVARVLRALRFVRGATGTWNPCVTVARLKTVTPVIFMSQYGWWRLESKQLRGQEQQWKGWTMGGRTFERANTAPNPA